MSWPWTPHSQALLQSVRGCSSGSMPISSANICRCNTSATPDTAGSRCLLQRPPGDNCHAALCDAVFLPPLPLLSSAFSHFNGRCPYLPSSHKFLHIGSCT